ncbi:MAG: ABC transporter ATP-binding protein [Candidatus Contubernalis sp.]|nr:ABC transporter ATP-binding protein [Candidatus Contubernalis sp.]
MKTYFRTFALLQGMYGKLVIKIILGLLITVTFVGQAFAVAGSMNSIFSRQGLERLPNLLAFIAVMVLLRAVLLWANEVYGRKTIHIVKTKLRERLFNKILALGPEFQNANRTGTVQSVITDGVEALEPFLIMYLPQVIVTVIGSGFLTWHIWRLDWVPGVVVLCGVLLAVSVPLLSTPVTGKIIMGYWRSYAALNSQYIDAMQGITTLKVFNVSGAKGKELAGKSWELYQYSMKGLTVSLIDSTVVGWASAAGVGFAAAAGTVRVMGGHLELAGLFVILFLTVECFRPLQDLSRYWHQSYMGLSAARNFYEILDQEVKINDPKVTLVEKLGSEVKKQIPGIEIKNVSFAYNEGSRPALEDVSIKIEPGETVALVGKSGSGKSTLINLLLRFYEPQQGEIIVDGKNIRDYSLAELRGLMSVVFQDTYLFYGTVADNLKIARPNAKMEEIITAAKQANAHEFIKDLKEGYHTVIGERGIKLSGGQRQRLAIARAVLKDAPVLILDEATSNVDADSEQKIQEALGRLTETRTTIIIAHRLSTIKNAQRIFVFDDRCLVEHGNHQELVLAKGTYYSLVQAQQA